MMAETKAETLATRKTALFLFLALFTILAIFGFNWQPTVADTPLPAITVGTEPDALAVNPVTNKTYVANYASDTVTVIDATAVLTKTIAVGDGPTAVVVNTSSNKVYAANENSDTVSIIDGSSDTVIRTVSVQARPVAMAVNSVTGNVYVACAGSDSVSIIDSLNHVSTIPGVGLGAYAIAVNPVTNRVYVGCAGVAYLPVLDAADNNALSFIALPLTIQNPLVTVNAITNKVYIAAGDASSAGSVVLTIQGADESGDGSVENNQPLASVPHDMALNPVSNKVYVGHGAGVTELDGETNELSSITGVSGEVRGVAVNVASNKVYATSYVDDAVQVIDPATRSVLQTVTTGDAPRAVAVNPVTNRVYIANQAGGSVSVIDGASYSEERLVMDSIGQNVVVNEITGKAYVAINTSSIVTVFDPQTKDLTNVTVEPGPTALAVNPITNEIWVGGDGQNRISVIDGENDTANTISMAPRIVKTLALNPVTNRVYVAHHASDEVSVIDGDSGAVLEILSVGDVPNVLAVNAVSNKVYVANQSSNSVSVIDGATNAVTTIPVGASPRSLAVNSVTNKVFVGNYNGNSVTVIDGALDVAVATISGGLAYPKAIAVDPFINQLYVVNGSGKTVTVIDVETNETTPITLTAIPLSVVVNPLTNKAYVGTFSGVTVIDGHTLEISALELGASNFLAFDKAAEKLFAVDNNTLAELKIVDEQARQDVPLTVAVALDANGDPLATNHVTTSSRPTFLVQATSAYSPISPPPGQVFYQLDTLTGPWTLASAPLFQTPILSEGMHILYAFAVDGQESNLSNAGLGHSPVIGKVTAYPFLVRGIDVDLASQPNPSAHLAPVILTATAKWQSTREPVTAGSFKFYDGSTLLGEAVAVDDSGQASLSTSALGAGNHTINAEYYDEYGNHCATDSVSHRVDGAITTTTLVAEPNPSCIGQSLLFTATVTSDAGVPTGAVTFCINEQASGTTSLDEEGEAVYSKSDLPIGTHNIVAKYNGSAEYATSESDPLSCAVEKWNPGISLTSDPNPSFYGDSVVFTASVTSDSLLAPTGAVTFFVDDGVERQEMGRADVVYGVAELTVSHLAVGEIAVIAAYSGDDNFTAGESGVHNHQVNNPAPTITGFDPAFVDAGGDDFTLTVEGGYFVDGALIKVGDSYHYDTVFIDSNTLTTTLTAEEIFAPGWITIMVENPPPCGACEPELYPVNFPKPTITGTYTITVGGGDTYLELEGTGFYDGSTELFWDGEARDTTVMSSTQLKALILASDLQATGDFSVTVKNPQPGGGEAETTVSVVAENPEPKITSLYPTEIRRGGTGISLEVYGSDFVDGAVVKWNGAERDTVYESSAHLTAAILATDIEELGTVTITVANPGPGGGESNESSLTIHYKPELTDFSPGRPIAGRGNCLLTVYGSCFEDGAVVTWDGEGRETEFVSETQLIATILASDIADGGTARIRVVNPGLSGMSGERTVTVYNPPPILDSINPTSATAGGEEFTLTVAGEDFVPSSVITWDGEEQVTVFVNGTELTTIIAADKIAAAGEVEVKVVNPSPEGGSSATKSFEIKAINPAPTVSSISPASTTAGGPDFTLSVDGTNFVNGSVVQWGEHELTTNFLSATKLEAQVAASRVATAGTVQITVRNPEPGGGLSNSKTFTITSSQWKCRIYLPLVFRNWR